MPYRKKQFNPETDCGRCAGCGQISDGDPGEPWSAWMALPVESAVGMLAGIVKPIDCPDCNGTGERPKTQSNISASEAVCRPEMIETQRTIVEWADKEFGPVSGLSRVAARANAEMAELLRVVTSNQSNMLENAVYEAADVVIILYRLADIAGFDLHSAIDAKMAINRNRKWDTSASDGHGYHTRSGK